MVYITDEIEQELKLISVNYITGRSGMQNIATERIICYTEITR